MSTFVHGFVDSLRESEGFNQDERAGKVKLRERQADDIENAINGIQKRTDLSPQEKTFQIGEARKQLQGLYQPHEGEQLMKRLGKLFGRSKGGVSVPGQPVNDTGGVSVGGDTLQKPASGVTLKPGMTLDEVLSQGAQPANAKPVAGTKPFKNPDGSFSIMTQKPDGTFAPQPLPGYTEQTDAQAKLAELQEYVQAGILTPEDVQKAIKVDVGVESKPGTKTKQAKVDRKNGVTELTDEDGNQYTSLTEIPADRKDLRDKYATADKQFSSVEGKKEQAQEDKEARSMARAEKLAQLHADISERAKEMAESRKIPLAVAGRVSQAEIIKEQTAALREMLKDPELQQYMGPIAGRTTGAVARLYDKKVQDFFASQESLDALLPLLHGYRGGAQTHKTFKDAMGALTIDPKAYEGTLDALDKMSDNVVEEVKQEYPNAPMFNAAALKGKGYSLATKGKKGAKEEGSDPEIDAIVKALNKK